VSRQETIAELLVELSEDNPRPAEPWSQEDGWDPRFRRGTLRKAARQKQIEIDASDPDNWRFRFTPKGRDTLESLTGAYQ
jgi:hypothetical protein